MFYKIEKISKNTYRFDEKQLQAEFNLSQIPYTEDYYAPGMNVAAPEVPTEWAVYYDSGY